MKAIVKGMGAGFYSVDLDAYYPDDPEIFELWIDIMIGQEDEIGSDDFRLHVCTPKWLQQNVWEPQWGRHMLIVRTYDLSAIKKCVYDYVGECTGEDWQSIAKKIARNLAWEFEDYQP
jgi:hypothetical protein